MLQPPRSTEPDFELRPSEESDSTALFAIVNGDREFLRQYQNWPDYLRTELDIRRLIRRAQNRLEYDNGFDLLILQNGDIMGKIGLVHIDWDRRVTEIGYWLRQSAQGHGFVTRACRILLDYAFDVLALDEVRIRCAIDNRRSRAVAERLGFYYKGVMPHTLWLHGIPTQELLYTMDYRRWDTLNAGDTQQAPR